jgi:hypothetical protein
MGDPAIAVVERNRAAGIRIARIFSAAADLAPVVLATTPEQAESQLSAAPRLVGCDLTDLPAVFAWFERRGRAAPLVVWSADGPAAIRAAQDPRVRHLVGWPSFLSIPRPTELAMVVRRVLTPDLPLPPLSQLLAWGACHAVYRPSTTAERDQVVGVVVGWLRDAGLPERSATRAGEVAHELLTNAMYAAPVDAWGRAPYTHQRSAPIHLGADEIPTLEVAFDGQLLVIEVSDRFGRLRDEQVVASLVRGVDNQSASDGPILDMANGGAGIGLGLIHASSIGLVVEVVPGRSSRVGWYHDVDLQPRDYRSLPASLHLFRTAPGEVQ